MDSQTTDQTKAEEVKSDVESAGSVFEILALRKDSLSALRDALFVVSLYLYFAGFTYYHTLLSMFGIPFSGSDFPVVANIVFAYNVFRECSSSIYREIILLLISPLLCIFLLTKLGSIHKISLFIQKTSRTIVAFAWLFVAIFIFPLIHTAAESAAADEADKIRTGFGTPIQLFPRKASHDLDEIAKASEHGETFLLLDSHDEVYVLRASHDPDALQKVYRIDKKEIAYDVVLVR